MKKEVKKTKLNVVNGKLNLKVIIKGLTIQEAIDILEAEKSKLQSIASLEEN